MTVLPGESWSWARHARQELLPHVRTFKTLRRMIVAVAAGLDEGRAHNHERMAAYFHHVYRMLESAAKDAEHDLTWSFPKLGVEDPDAQQREAGWSTAEASALTADHKERHLMQQVRTSYRQREGIGKQGPAGAGEAPSASSSSGAGGLQEQMRAMIRAELKGKTDKPDKDKKGKGEPKGGGRGGGGAGGPSA